MVDADEIRVAFIRSSLKHARYDEDRATATRTAREFRRYLDWHRDMLPEADRNSISEELSDLERRCRIQ